MAESDNDDELLDAYLKGDSDLSRAYRKQGLEEPPAELGDMLIAEARRVTKSRPRFASSPFAGNWMVPASLAAVLVLSVGIVNLFFDEPDPSGIYVPASKIVPEITDNSLPRITEETMSDNETMEAAQSKEKDADRISSLNAPAFIPDSKMLPAKKAKRRKDNPVSAPIANLSGTLDQTPRANNEPDKRVNDGRLKRQSRARLPERVVQDYGLFKEKPEVDELESEDQSNQQQKLSRLTAPREEGKSVAAYLKNTEIWLENISRLRQQGNIEQAQQEIDAFTKLYFPEKDNASGQYATLSEKVWLTYIDELRSLDRNDIADSSAAIFKRVYPDYKPE